MALDKVAFSKSHRAHFKFVSSHDDQPRDQRPEVVNKHATVLPGIKPNWHQGLASRVV